MRTDHYYEEFSTISIQDVVNEMFKTAKWNTTYTIDTDKDRTIFLEKQTLPPRKGGRDNQWGIKNNKF